MDPSSEGSSLGAWTAGPSSTGTWPRFRIGTHEGARMAAEAHRGDYGIAVRLTILNLSRGHDEEAVANRGEPRTGRLWIQGGCENRDATREWHANCSREKGILPALRGGRVLGRDTVKSVTGEPTPF